jgi:hypothetical protein
VHGVRVLRGANGGRLSRSGELMGSLMGTESTDMDMIATARMKMKKSMRMKMKRWKTSARTWRGSYKISSRSLIDEL